MLQRIDAESVLYLEGGELSVRSIRLDKIFAVRAEETRTNAIMVESCVLKIAEHRFLCRVIHGVLVLRVAPQRGLHPMTSRARLAADKFRRRLFCLLRALEYRPPGHEQAERQNNDKSGGKTRRSDPKQRREALMGLV